MNHVMKASRGSDDILKGSLWDSSETKLQSNTPPGPQATEPAVALLY